MLGDDPQLEATDVVIATLRLRPPVRAEYVYAAIGPADDRAVSDEDSVVRMKSLTDELLAAGWLRQHAPELQALAVLGLLDDVDWERVLAGAVVAARPLN